MKKYLIALPMLLASANLHAALMESGLIEDKCLNKKICEFGEVYNELTCECEKGGLGGGLELGCLDCESTSWTATPKIGYEVKTSATCNKNTGMCFKASLYRCMAGWYGDAVGDAPENLSGCEMCPLAGADFPLARVTSTPGTNSSITDCHIVAGTSGTNSSGEYVLTDACHYTE